MTRGKWLWQQTNSGWALSVAAALGSRSQWQIRMKPMNRSEVNARAEGIKGWFCSTTYPIFVCVHHGVLMDTVYNTGRSGRENA